MWAGRGDGVGGVPMYPELAPGLGLGSGELGMGDAPGVNVRKSLLDDANADSDGCEFDMCRYEMNGTG